jgi:hypothetical protein
LLLVDTTRTSYGAPAETDGIRFETELREHGQVFVVRRVGITAHLESCAVGALEEEANQE